MAQRPINFDRPVLGQSRIQGDEFLVEIGTARGCAKPRIPLYADERQENYRAESPEKIACVRFELKVSTV